MNEERVNISDTLHNQQYTHGRAQGGHARAGGRRGSDGDLGLGILGGLGLGGGERHWYDGRLSLAARRKCGERS